MRIIFVLLISIVTSGCSTFEVYKEYQLSEKSELNSIEREGLSAELVFSESNSFYSIGILGLPIIPTHVRIVDDNEFKFHVNARLYKGHELSVKRRLCFDLSSEEQLCASRLDIEATMYQVESVVSDGKQTRWRYLEGFHKSEFSVQHTLPWVTLNNIYVRHNYTENQDYDIISINYSFTFQCNGKCPDKFKFDGNSFFKVDEQLISLGSSEYSLQMGNRYYFSRIVQ